jgi:hypothetical protein
VGVLKTLTKGKNKIPPGIDHRYMINVVTSEQLDLSFIDTQRHCHRRNREYTVGDYCRYMEPSDGEKCSPPNGVIAMVSTLATKNHKTLHHGETDECMVCPCLISFNATNQIYARFPFSTRRRMVQIVNRNTSWVLETGAASTLTTRLAT